MRLRVLLLMAIAATAPLLVGCLACEPLLEVQRCHGGVGACTPDAPMVHEWDATHASAWPDVDGLLRSMVDVDHEELDWTREKEDAFWQYWDMQGEDHRKDLYVMFEDDVYRIRVLTCD